MAFATSIASLNIFSLPARDQPALQELEVHFQRVVDDFQAWIQSGLALNSPASDAFGLRPDGGACLHQSSSSGCRIAANLGDIDAADPAFRGHPKEARTLHGHVKLQGAQRTIIGCLR